MNAIEGGCGTCRERHLALAHAFNIPTFKALNVQLSELVMWGNETVVRERLGPGVSNLTMTWWHSSFDYPLPPAEVVELLRL